MSQTPTVPPPVTAPPASPIPPQAGMVDTDRPCVQCSYNLRGLSIAGHCPECGTPVQNSLRGILLQFASPDYLAKVRTGLQLVLTGILIYIVLQIGMMLAGFLTLRMGGTGMGLTLLSTVLGLGVQGMILLGYWRYTEPDPGFVGTDLPDTPRKVVRIAVAAQAVTALIQALLTLGMLASSVGGGTMGLAALSLVLGIISLAGLAAWIAGFIGIMLYTQWMAKRIPDQYIVNRAKLYLWLLPVIAVVGIVVIIGPLIALILYWNLLDRMRKHLKSIIATGEPATLPARFG